MGRARSAILAILAGVGLTGCPPTGDPPPFDPVVPDMAPDPVDMAPDVGPDPCEDLDDDGYVAAEGCALPAGDCAPEDAARNPGAAEICNLRDDNCDGVTDEGDPGGGEACQTDAPGTCAAGTTACVQGEVVCEQTVRPNADEACDGRDDDCDGETDESVPGLGGRCETGADGVCAGGAEACVGGRVICQPTTEPSPETCNGEDDDCDTLVDEGDPGGGGACDTGLQGVCSVGVETCNNGGVVCATTTEPAPEICNRLDDDCDGRTDETFAELGAACTVGTGACERASTFICDPSGERVVCDATAGDGSPELCNGADDDCDGSVDEGFPLGEACTNGEGACERPGQTVCAGDASGVVCDAVPGEAFDEQCNGLDDDCDGQTDEEFPTLGDPCVDNSGQCPSPGTLVCAQDGAGVACDAEPVDPQPETCNDLDDDCDDLVDEAFPDKGAECAVGVGACRREGALGCAEGGAELACSVVAGDPVAELCNGEDDDCDGRIDNGAPCVGPPAGVVVGVRIAEFGEAVCADLSGDGQADNALGGVAGLFNPPLRDLVAASPPALVRAPGLPGDQITLEWLPARTDAQGTVLPRSEALTPTGEARAQLPDQAWADGTVAGGLPAPWQVLSPLFAAEGGEPYRSASAFPLRDARVTGPLAPGAEGGLTSAGLVLSGWLPRAELLAAYGAADAACAAAGDGAPPGCAGRISPDILAANLQADLERDGAVDGLDAISVCLVVELAPALDPASNPAAGPVACQADGDCYQGLVCRALPWVAEGAPGAALAQRCGLPGQGDLPQGAACATHEDCRTGLCVGATAAGGRCTALCDADEACPQGEVCRGVPVPDVEGAVDQGGRTAKACVPVGGSGTPCPDTNNCADGETCTPWIGDGAGVAGAAVALAPTCDALDPAGAGLGEACAGPLDCARGLGCVADFQGNPVCAPTCGGQADCRRPAVCVDRPFVAAAGDQPALNHGVCLTLPPAAGSGAVCDADADCPPTEICQEAWLSRAGSHGRWCAAGAGFLSAGQPCRADGDCARGLCVGGRCGGPCAEDADCGDPNGCVPEAWTDADGRVVGGACSPATAACVRDRDCSQADPLCVGDRCVCDGACRIGCRPGGVCADGAWCQPDGVCAQFCRDDASEPNDTVGSATLLPAGRAAPNLSRVGELCARSPVDWYAFSAGGQTFEARLVPLDGEPVFDFGLFDSNGGLIAAAERGDDGTLAVRLDDPAAAAARLGQNLALRVRASGTFDQTTYRLEIDVTFPECPDPADEPRDASWQATEILTQPGAADAQNVDGWICPQDTDWYGMFLAPGDTVRLSLTNRGNAVGAPALVDAALVGPDWPDAGRARVLSQILPDQVTEYTVPGMFCDPNTSFCAMADGTPTDIFCGGDDADCTGIGYFVRLRGAGAFDVADYTLQAEVQRVDDVLCVPDLFEHNGNFQLFNRVHAAMDPALRAFEGPRHTIPIGQQVNFTRLRACGGPGPLATALDADNFMVWLNVGEQLIAAAGQQGNQRLQLDTYQVDQAIERLNAIASTEPVIIDTIDVRESGFYAVAVLRAGDEGQAGYTNSTPYTLSMVRLPVGFVPDTACQDPVRLNLVDGVAEQRGSTEGANDDHQPLDCLGGNGPDRVYVVRVPPGPGVLRATVVRDADVGYDPSVSIRTDCAVANSEVACNEDDAEAIDPFAQAKTQGVVQGGGAGRDVFVVVDSHSAATPGPFRLLLRYIDGDDCDLNTGICADPCEGVVCAGRQICDPDDGQCVDCFVDGQCQFGERCQERRCVPGADRAISDWGADGASSPECLNATQCTPDEVCSAIPFTNDDYCLLACNDNLACPDGFRCCRPPIPVGPGQFCVTANNPLGGLCE